MKFLHFPILAVSDKNLYIKLGNTGCILFNNDIPSFCQITEFPPPNLIYFPEVSNPLSLPLHFVIFLLFFPHPIITEKVGVAPDSEKFFGNRWEVSLPIEICISSSCFLPQIRGEIFQGKNKVEGNVGKLNDAGHKQNVFFLTNASQTNKNVESKKIDVENCLNFLFVEAEWTEKEKMSKLLFVPELCTHTQQPNQPT